MATTSSTMKARNLSLYGQYVEEREGKHYFEIAGKGFATYHIIQREPKEVYIEDIYVVPEFRKTGVASQMADFICDLAKNEFGCQYLTGTVNPKMLNSTESLKALLAYGMKLLNLRQDGLIWFVKKIEE